jgi:hypothetical protein
MSPIRAARIFLVIQHNSASRVRGLCTIYFDTKWPQSRLSVTQIEVNQ